MTWEMPRPQMSKAESDQLFEEDCKRQEAIRKLRQMGGQVITWELEAK